MNLNNTNKLIVLSVYAPTLEKSEKTPEEADNFYVLGSVIRKVKSRNDIIIAGDFNAKTGSAALADKHYKNQIGIYGKGIVNNNGYGLLDFARSYNLKRTNTFYKHKQCHRSTWESPIKIPSFF